MFFLIFAFPPSHASSFKVHERSLICCVVCSTPLGCKWVLVPPNRLKRTKHLDCLLKTFLLTAQNVLFYDAKNNTVKSERCTELQSTAKSNRHKQQEVTETINRFRFSLMRTVALLVIKFLAP